MKKLTLASSFALVSLLGFSQQNTVSTGGNASGSGGTVSYSVGQIDYSSNQGTNGTINQGVQQPFEFYLLEIDEENALNISLFPNPTNEFIVLQFENFTNGLSFSLYDMNGRIVVENNIDSAKTEIDMRSFATGQYNLAIKNQVNNIQSIKIIKN